MSLCLEEKLKHDMKLLACCGEYSRYLVALYLNDVAELVCAPGDREETTSCRFMKVLIKQEPQDLIYKFIEGSGICGDNCTLDLTKLRKSNEKPKRHKIKRQFDTASAMALFQDGVCKISDEDILQSLIHGPKQSEEVEELFTIAVIARGPLCCLFEVWTHTI